MERTLYYWSPEFHREQRQNQCRTKHSLLLKREGEEEEEENKWPGQCIIWNFRSNLLYVTAAVLACVHKQWARHSQAFCYCSHQSSPNFTTKQKTFVDFAFVMFKRKTSHWCIVSHLWSVNHIKIFSAR